MTLPDTIWYYVIVILCDLKWCYTTKYAYTVTEQLWWSDMKYLPWNLTNLTMVTYINSLNMLGNLPHITHVYRCPTGTIFNQNKSGWWFQPLWKIWKSAGIIIIPTIGKSYNSCSKQILVSWDHCSQYMEKHKNHVPNHQPEVDV